MKIYLLNGFLIHLGNHTSLIAVFTFKRRIGYFLIETWIPSSIVVAISWVSFWISPKAAPARVALGITTILTMVTISSSARQSLPKVRVLFCEVGVDLFINPIITKANTYDRGLISFGY